MVQRQPLARSVSGKGPGGLRRQEAHKLATTMLPSSMRSYGMMDGVKKAVTEANAVRDKEVAEVRLPPRAEKAVPNANAVWCDEVAE